MCCGIQDDGSRHLELMYLCIFWLHKCVLIQSCNIVAPKLTKIGQIVSIYTTLSQLIRRKTFARQANTHNVVNVMTVIDNVTRSRSTSRHTEC